MVVVDTITNGIELMPDTQKASEITLGLHVSEGVHADSCENEHAHVSKGHIVMLGSHSALKVAQVVGNVEGHLWGGDGSAVVVVDHSVLQLSGHADDHVVEIWVKIFTVGNIQAVGGFIVIASQHVVNVVDATWSHSDFAEIGWPNTTVCVFALILREVWWIHAIFDTTISLVPFLVVVLFEVVMRWMDREHRNHFRKLQLSVASVKDFVVFGVDVSVTISAIFGEDLETSTD